MQDTHEVFFYVSLAVLIAATIVMMHGHRAMARRLAKDPQHRPRRSAELAVAWPQLLIALAFPLSAVFMPRDFYREWFAVTLVVFYALGVIWLLALRKSPESTRSAAEQMFGAAVGPREHGETAEHYHQALRRSLPWSTVLLTLAFVIALVRTILRL